MKVICIGVLAIVFIVFVVGMIWLACEFITAPVVK